MFSSRMHVMSSLPNGQFLRDNNKLCKRHVLIADAGYELTPGWLNVARQHQVVPVPQSPIMQPCSLHFAQRHQATCAPRFLHHFCGLTSASEQNPLTGRGRIFGTCRGFMRNEDIVHDECPSPWCPTRADTRVRRPAPDDVTFSEAGRMQRLCMRQLRICTDSKFPKNPHAVASSSLQTSFLVHDLGSPSLTTSPICTCHPQWNHEGGGAELGGRWHQSTLRVLSA